MKRITLTVLVLLALVVAGHVDAYSNGATYQQNEYYPVEEDTRAGTDDIVSEDKTGPDPQRIYCKKYWNSYYSEYDIDVEVTTRGEYDEIVVFNCPQCSLEEHYVDPFMNTVTDGLSGEERIRACGFKKAVFIGAKGIREIERDI